MTIPRLSGRGRRRVSSHIRTSSPGLVLTVLAALSLVVSACGGNGEGGTTTAATPSTTMAADTTTAAPVTTEAPTTTAAPTTTTTQMEPLGVAVYFMLEQLEGEDPPGPLLVPVYRDVTPSGNLGQLVVEVLLKGPTEDEKAGVPAMSTAIPEGTLVLGVSVEGGVATVNLSDTFDSGGGSFSMFARLAQVVYTLTRLPDIDSVVFQIEGNTVTVFSSEGIELDGPQKRDDYYDLVPLIFVDSPAWGEPVTSPMEVSGLSNVFEAVSQVMLTDDDGATLFDDKVMATCGTGCWGEWSAKIPYTLDREQVGALIVWEFSAKDGSRIHVREYPIQLR